MLCVLPFLPYDGYFVRFIVFVYLLTLFRKLQQT